MAALPTSPVPTSVLPLRSMTSTRISVAQSFKRQVRTTGAQRWATTLSWGPDTQANLAPIWAFLLAQDGQFATFTVVLPPPYNVPLGSWAGGAPQVNGASQTGSAINLKNFTAGQTGVVKAGDLIKFADTKVYMATADANSDGSGLATVSIKPKLIVSPANSEAVVFTAVPFTMQVAADLNELQIRPGATVSGLWSLSQALLEAY